jgi:hypothetical protein
MRKVINIKIKANGVKWIKVYIIHKDYPLSKRKTVALSIMVFVPEIV